MEEKRKEEIKARLKNSDNTRPLNSLVERENNILKEKEIAENKEKSQARKSNKSSRQTENTSNQNNQRPAAEVKLEQKVLTSSIRDSLILNAAGKKQEIVTENGKDAYREKQ